MSTELDAYRWAEKQSEVISMWARGFKEIEILRQAGVTKKQFNEMLADYKQYALQDRVLREMSRETLIKTRQHYDDILEQMYRATAEAEANGDYKVQLDGLKKIADVENQRVAFMQKAGMLADNELGTQLADYEHKQEVVVNILRDIAKKHPDIGLEIQTRLAEVTGKIEGVPSERMDR